MLPRATLLLIALRAYAAAPPTFNRDVLPILQHKCQECHRPGETAPMPLLNYRQTRPWAKAIRNAVAAHKMPPWFADPCCGKFSNDRSLTPTEREILMRWADSGAAEGDLRDTPRPRRWITGWNLPSLPDVVLKMPVAFSVPARGPVEYQYFIVPTGFTQDRWISAAEVRPGAASAMHHAVVYIREPGDTWTHGPTKADILTVYTPGYSADVLPQGMAKLVKTGSDLVFEIHYTPDGKPARDLTEVGVIFAKSEPVKRVLTLQLNNSTFIIPPNDPDARVMVSGTLPNDALLLSFFPHMHLRGKAFEYARYTPDGRRETLLKVAPYDFYWQLSYRLAEPLSLAKGTRLEAVGWFDNSRNNPRNPDPGVAVRYGQQSWEEMMIGFFDVAVDPGIDKPAFFVR